MIHKIEWNLFLHSLAQVNNKQDFFLHQRDKYFWRCKQNDLFNILLETVRMNLMTLFVKMAQNEDLFVILFVNLSFEHQVGLV